MILPTEAAKWARTVQEIWRTHQTGRPALIGTRSIRASERLRRRLEAKHLDHRVLNAIHHRQEVQIDAGAGQQGRTAVAANMAGRRTDITLGRGVAELGGLHVIAAEPSESARIGRQLFGRAALQSDPGGARGIFSLDDEIAPRYAGNAVAYLKRRYAHPKDNILSPGVRAVFRLAQRRAEGFALGRRTAVLRTDHWLDERRGFAGRE